MDKNSYHFFQSITILKLSKYQNQNCQMTVGRSEIVKIY